MAGSPYIWLLVIGTVIIIVDGQLLLRTARSYLSGGARDPRNGKQLSILVALLFHLLMLGVVALVDSIDLGPHPEAPEILRRLGVMLILIALGHAATILVLSRMRADQADAERVETLARWPRGATANTERPAAPRTAAAPPPNTEPPTARTPVPDPRTDSESQAGRHGY